MKKQFYAAILACILCLSGKSFATIYDCRIGTYDNDGDTLTEKDFAWDTSADEIKTEEFGFDELVGSCMSRDGVVACIISHRDNMNNSTRKEPFVYSITAEPTMAIGVSLLRSQKTLKVTCVDHSDKRLNSIQRFKL